MKQRYEEPVLTRILKEDAKRVCSRKRMERFWKNFEKKLDRQQYGSEKEPLKRVFRTVGFWILTVYVCLTIFIGSAILIRNVLTPVLSGTGAVTIAEQPTPLAATPNTDTAYYRIVLVIAFGLSAVMAVIIYRVMIHLRYKNLVRRVIIKAIRTGERKKNR